MNTTYRYSVIAVGVIACFQAHALTLGEVKLRSFLMEPLRAEIPIVEADKKALEDLKVSLAPQADFDRFGVARLPIHNTVLFNIVRKDDAWSVDVTTPGPMREPYFSFPVEAAWRAGQYIREYTVFLDPRPVARAASMQSTEPKPEPVSQLAAAPQPEPASPEPAQAIEPEQQSAPEPDAVAEPVAAPAPPSVEFWPVRRGETLWIIAEEVKPVSATTYQMMMALLRANPEAFVGGNVNNLISGSNLRVPDSGEIQTLNAREARAAFNRQTRVWREVMEPETAVEVAKPAIAETPEAAVTQAAEDTRLETPVAEPAPAATEQEERQAEAEAVVPPEVTEEDDSLRIIADAPKLELASKQALEIAELERQLLLALEQTEADRLEFVALNEQVEQIQAEMMRMRRLLILKNEQITALQAAQDNQPLPPRVDIDKVAPRPEDADMVKADVQDKAAVAALDKPENIAADSNKDIDWGIWGAIIAGLLGVLALVWLFMRRDRDEFVLADHPGVPPDVDQPYTDVISHYGGNKDALSVEPTGHLEPHASQGAQSSSRLATVQREEDWKRDDFGAEDSIALDDLSTLAVDSPSYASDDELKNIVADLNADTEATAELDIDRVISPAGWSEQETPEPAVGQSGDTTESAEEELTDVAALRLELAQAYLEIGEIDGARDILTQVVEEAMEGPEQVEARRLLETLKAH